MCSNTIYILNNTLIECFDIAFNETKKVRKEKQTQLFVFDFTKEKCTATSPKNGSMERKLHIELFCWSYVTTEL